MPAALVTGAAGQDGSFLVERLVADGWSVTGLVRDPSDSVPAGARTVVADLGDTERLASIVDDAEADVVFNLGALSSVAASWTDPLATARITGMSVAALLDAAWRRQESTGSPVRFVQASSAEVFGAATELPQSETTPIAPVSPYGAAKAWAHSLVGVYRGRGLFASNAILYNHESTRRPTAFVTRKITRGVAEIAAGTAETLTLGNLDARRDWGWAPDYVDALVLIAGAETPDDFVVATGESHTVAEFVEAAFAAVGITDWRAYVTSDPRFMRPSEQPEQRGDPSKIERALGWRRTHDFAGIVAAMVAHDLDEIRAGR
ncbi:GDP-mannose 4,6-dehydratase [Herbiconiux sp. L3-i23]|uniref:GDP-mannose 4,6-dehydratase n=1 Tax=Herbiconiux sp. L3-i23 TaxID=2905871 RepID=UPI002065C646|nr:GDP-mannose 4,6-dehydratase [Herbiconiux sp. L3-i23]BDI21669.1 GDP-mannose 4,6-dehydratase [Herbiconiux sp. L3-i23]